ncbi:unnamed protein product [Rhizophagus irregularis]|nr:unnamed protein product [Rhizophagus irregularis]
MIGVTFYILKRQLLGIGQIRLSKRDTGFLELDELDFRKDAGFLELDKTGHSERDTNFLDLGEMTIWIDMNASFAMYYSFAALILRH